MPSRAAEGVCIFSAQGSLFRSDEKGNGAAAAVVGSSQFACVGHVDVSILRLGTVLTVICKDVSTKKQLCRAQLGSQGSGSLSVQSENYATFTASDGKQHSIYFTDAENICTLAVHEAMANAYADGLPLTTTTTAELFVGRGETVSPGDAVGVRFSLHTLKEDGSVGRLLASNIRAKHTYKYGVPNTNKQLDPGMKGFEGAVLGMRQGGRRAAVLPPACRGKVGVADTESVVIFLELAKLKSSKQGGFNASFCQSTAVLPLRESASDETALEVSPQASGSLPKGGQLVLSSAVPPPPPPALPASHMKAIKDTEASVTSLIDITTELVGKVETVQKDMKSLKPSKKLPITTSEAMHNLQVLLTDTAKLQDALIEKDNRIRDLEVHLNHLGEPPLEAKDHTRLVARDIDGALPRLREAEGKLKATETKREEAVGEGMLIRVELEAAKAKVQELTHTLEEERRSKAKLEERLDKRDAEAAQLQQTAMEKTQEVAELSTRLEAEKKRFMTLLEDEQHRGDNLIETMKDDMVKELKVRSERFQQEKVKIADESFTSGIDHGRQVAESELRMRWETEIRDLKMENTRLQAHLDASKAELTLERSNCKTTIERLCYPDESNLKELEVLQQHIDTLQTQLSDAYTQIAQEKEESADKADRLATSEQKLRDTETKCTAAVVALSRQVVPKHALVGLLQQVFKGEAPDTNFEQDQELYDPPSLQKTDPAPDASAEAAPAAPSTPAVEPAPTPAPQAATAPVDAAAAAPAAAQPAPPTVLVLPFPVATAVEAKYDDGTWYDAVIADASQQQGAGEGKCVVTWSADGYVRALDTHWLLHSPSLQLCFLCGCFVDPGQAGESGEGGEEEG